MAGASLISLKLEKTGQYSVAFLRKKPWLFNPHPIDLKPKCYEGQLEHTYYGGSGMKTTKMATVVSLALALSLTSGVSAFATDTPTAQVEKSGVSAEQKAAFKAAKEQFHAARQARQAAIAAAKANVAAAKASFAAAKAAATTAEEKKAARQLLHSAIEAAKASIPAKPTKPNHP